MKTFDSIEELAAVLRADDPPVPPILPGELEFERVHGTRGGMKIVPSADRAGFLYRGQNQRWQPCVPSVYRSAKGDEEHSRLDFLMSRIRIAEFEALLQGHPLIQYALQEHIELDYDALAQHYEIPTFWLDLTSSIDVACFFAVARRGAGREWLPCDKGTGVVYRVRWRDFVEPRRYFTSISHSPASRPGRQHAWAMGLNRGVDFDQAEFVEALEFRHSRSHAQQIIAAHAVRLYPHDSLADIADILKACPVVTMKGIKAALIRDGCPGERVEGIALQTARSIAEGLGLDVHLDEEFALTEEQLQAGEQEAAKLRQVFLSEIGFRLGRTRKASDVPESE
jgi:hypothetical protein